MNYAEAKQLADSLNYYKNPFVLLSVKDGVHSLEQNFVAVSDNYRNWLNKYLKALQPFQEDQVFTKIE